MMKPENWTLLAAWVVTLALLFAIPRTKIRIGLVALLFHQFITWPLGLVVVELGLLAYPDRWFPNVGRNSFTYEFIVYPAIAAVFVTHYPVGRPRLVQFGYYVTCCAVLTIPEVLLEAHTGLIRYLHWNWFCSWSTLLFTLLLTRTFCVIFFQARGK